MFRAVMSERYLKTAVISQVILQVHDCLFHH